MLDFYANMLNKNVAISVRHPPPPPHTQTVAPKPAPAAQPPAAGAAPPPETTAPPLPAAPLPPAETPQAPDEKPADGPAGDEPATKEGGAALKAMPWGYVFKEAEVVRVEKRATEGEVLDAKARYLARKRAREEQEAADAAAAGL
jgi:hypothetical protein